jgi:hypothetical protein
MAIQSIYNSGFNENILYGDLFRIDIEWKVISEMPSWWQQNG